MINLDACPICNAEIAKEGSSLHCWSIEYCCGMCILGGIGSDNFVVEKDCPLKK